MSRGLFAGVLAMAAVVVSSNILVQHLFGNWLTWGAFTYPIAFLVTDIMNRVYGVSAARKVVLAGFLAGIGCSFVGTQIIGEFGPLVTLRIAIGSGIAFLMAQLIDVAVFNRLREGAWWRAPLASTLIGSSIDTAFFFTISNGWYPEKNISGKIKISEPFSIDFLSSDKIFCLFASIEPNTELHCIKDILVIVLFKICFYLILAICCLLNFS